MKSKILNIYSWFIRSFLFFLPDIPIIMRLRGCLYSVAMPNCGANFQVSNTSVLYGLGNLYIGKNVYIAHNVFIGARCRINIGNDVLIGINTVMISGNHTLKNKSFRFGKPNLKPILIEDGVWIASNVTITAGTRIKKGALIGSSCSANGDYDEFSINLGKKATKQKHSNR